MKLRYFTLVAAACAMTVITGCKKDPAEDINIKFNMDVLKNFVRLDFEDMGDPNVVPSNVKISITGDAKDDVYNLMGKKDFTVNGKTIQLGLAPSRKPQIGAPVKFLVKVSADGYVPVTQTVEINAGETNKTVKVRMLNILKPPTGFSTTIKSYTLIDGNITTPSITHTARTTADSTYYDDGLSSIVFPTGTSFYYYKWVKTGDNVGTLPSNNESVIVNGKIETYTAIPYWLLQQQQFNYEYKRTKYAGGAVKVICVYYNGQSIDMQWSNEYSYKGTVKNIKGESINLTELLYKSIIKKKLAYVYYLGTDVDGSTICLSPDENSKWFTSYVIDDNTINPVTNQKIKEGDLVEIGYDPFTAMSTITTEVKKAANGQLRVETKSTEAGYYYRAPYTTSYKYDFDVARNEAIPDVENIYSTVLIHFKGINFYAGHGLPQDGANVSLEGKVASMNPITGIDATMDIYYCGQTLQNGVKVNQGSLIKAYKDEYFSRLPSTVYFDFAITCRKQKTTVQPTYYTTLHTSQGKYFHCMVRNGKWSTRGLQAGEVCDFMGWIGDTYIEKTGFTVEQKNKIEKEFSGNEPVCNFY